MRAGYKAFCAHIDLMATSLMIETKPDEALARINDLKSFGDALFLFPGGEDYRVCFAGDSIFVIKELSPEQKIEALWPRFCGHIYALTSVTHDMETTIGNPGLRVVTSYGPLLQIFEPDHLADESVEEYTKNWFVLTGASAALKKCTEAEALGRKGGFLPNYVWHEKLDDPRSYWGTRCLKIPLENYQRPELYCGFYEQMLAKADQEAHLPPA